MDRTNQDQHFDAEYIDKLFSSRKHAPAKPEPEPVEAPVPPPVEVIPEEPKEVPVPPAKRPGIAYFLLTAIVCLLLGFLVGRLSAPKPTLDPDATISTTPPLTGIIIHPHPGNTDAPGIAVDYAAMSTKQLTDIAIQIPELANSFAVSTQLTPERYEALKAKNPVLTELEQRPDAVEQLAFYNFVSSSILGNPAATALIQYYVRYLGFDSYPPVDESHPDVNVDDEIDPAWEDDRRVYEKGASYTIYEYTRAPSYGYSEVTMPGNTAPMQTMTFEGEPLALTNAPDWILDSNFWVRIETQDTYLYQSPELKINADSPEQYVDEMLLYITPYYDTYGTKRGLMVFGFAQEQYHIQLEYQDRKRLTFPVCPTPPEDATTLELMEYAFLQTNLLEYIRESSQQDVCTYLPMRLLLEREDFFPTMLELFYNGQVLTVAIEDIPVFDGCALLLNQDFIKSKCPDDILKAYKMICNQDYIAYRDLTRPNIVLSSQSNIQATDYIIEAIPDSLAHIPMEQWNFCSRVDLKPSAELLPTEQWHLEISPTWKYLGEIGIVPYYTLASGEQQQGWLITGKIEETAPVEFSLYHEDCVLLTVNAVFVMYPAVT